MPFMDIIVTPEHNGTVTTRIYRKLTHMNQILHWDNYHHIGARYNAINTVTHTAKIVSSTQELF